MRRIPAQIFVVIVLLIAACSSKSRSGDQPSVLSQERKRPELPAGLRVEPVRLWPGEPLELFGGAHQLCARRHEAPVACTGILHWEVDTDVGNRVLVKTVDSPVAFSGWEPDVFSGGSTNFSYVRDGRLFHWVNENPARAMATAGAAVHVSGGASICYVTDDGAVHCQEDAACYKMGDAFARIEPIPPAFTVSVGNGIACSLVDNGEVYCWGILGKDLTECSLAPRLVGPLQPAVSVITGGANACALLTNGEVWCWGHEIYGPLLPGEPNGGFAPRPMRIPGVEDIVDLAGEGGDFLALTSDGRVWSWGGGSPGRVELPMPAIDVFTGADQCVLLQDHDIRCFGSVRRKLREGRRLESEDAWMYAEKYVWVEE